MAEHRRGRDPAVNRITVLPKEIADQIAAGEVIERPGSVVKELLENSLDAGAGTITVEIEGGGRTSIKVSDDGHGMTRDEAALALDRHATSKIRKVADLVGVPTFGFRGEALPAIASVSHFLLETAPGGKEFDGTGTAVSVVGGKVTGIETIARQPGTAVSAKRLFFNVPARRKFLRSQRSETRAVVEAVTTLALARLDVAFRLTSDGRQLLEAPRVADFSERVSALYGRRLAEGLVPVDFRGGPVTVRGYVQRPADVKPTGRKAFLFVNGRPFKDPFLVKAAEAGYRTALPSGMRPSLVLALEVPGDAVDVNVHPAKLEVRFRDRYLVERVVQEAVQAALGPVAAGARIPFEGPGEPRHWPEHFLPPTDRTELPDTSAAPSLFRPEEVSRPEGVGASLLQVHDTYIVTETPEGVAFIDQHSAHERVIYEETMHLLKDGHQAVQQLLLPITVDLGPKELEVVEEFGDLFESIGFELEPFGGNSVVLQGVPNPHVRFDAKRCFEDLVSDLAGDRLGGLNRLERFVATYSCRAAVMAGQTLDERESRELIGRLFACKLPPHDVHGRPTIVQLPWAELERRFGRS